MQDSMDALEQIIGNNRFHLLTIIISIAICHNILQRSSEMMTLKLSVITLLPLRAWTVCCQRAVPPPPTSPRPPTTQSGVTTTWPPSTTHSARSPPSYLRQRTPTPDSDTPLTWRHVFHSDVTWLFNVSTRHYGNALLVRSQQACCGQNRKWFTSSLVTCWAMTDYTDMCSDKTEIMNPLVMVCWLGWTWSGNLSSQWINWTGLDRKQDTVSIQ